MCLLMYVTLATCGPIFSTLFIGFMWFHIIYSFHNQLKTVHLDGKVNRRVDFLIHHLLEYEKDAFFRYKSARQLPPAMNRIVKEKESRHQRGIQMPLSGQGHNV